MTHETRMLVDGKLVDAEAGATFAVVDPATGGEVGVVADGSHADLARAVVVEPTLVADVDNGMAIAWPAPGATDGNGASLSRGDAP
jgi:MinD superfamily P-loop ATPase